MRLAALLLALLATAASAEEYFAAKVIEAGRGTQLRAGLFGGAENANVNGITVEFNGMRYSAEWQTITPGGKNAASNFIVGSEVQARVHKDRQLWILREDGRPLRVKIVRRELVDD